MKVSSKLLSDYRAKLEAFNEAFGKDNGIVVKVGAMTYSDTNFTFKSEAIVGGSPEEIDKAEFERYASVMGFKRDDYGKEVLINGVAYLFVGLKPRSPKMCCVVERKGDKKRYKVSKETINSKI